jgi:hypothetical protein
MERNTCRNVFPAVEKIPESNAFHEEYALAQNGQLLSPMNSGRASEKITPINKFCSS